MYNMLLSPSTQKEGRRAFGDITNTPPQSKTNLRCKFPDLSNSAKVANSIQAVASTPVQGVKAQQGLVASVCKKSPSCLRTPKIPGCPEQELLQDNVQLTPPECKAMLNAINSAVDATEEKPGAFQMPSSLEDWMEQVGITDNVSGTLKEQLQILYDRACESARLRSYMEAMKYNELEMAAHEADDTARQMDMLADENTFLYESKSSLMNDNELLRLQLQEAQARLEIRMELQQQEQQQQLQLEYHSRQALEHQQVQEQHKQPLNSDMVLGRGPRAQVPPTPALICTPDVTQMSALDSTPAWVTTRQDPCAPSPGLSKLSIHTPSLDETEAWMQVNPSMAANRELTPMETPSLADALAWVDSPFRHTPSTRHSHGPGFGSPQHAKASNSAGRSTNHLYSTGSSALPHGGHQPSQLTYKYAATPDSGQPPAPNSAVEHANPCADLASADTGARTSATAGVATSAPPAQISARYHAAAPVADLLGFGEPTMAQPAQIIGTNLAAADLRTAFTPTVDSPEAESAATPHQVQARSITEPGVGVALWADVEGAVQLRVKAIENGSPSAMAPTPGTQEISHLSTLGGSQLSMVSSWTPEQMMYTDWAAAAGLAPDAPSRTGSQLSVVSHWSAAHMLFEDWAAAVAAGRTPTSSGQPATLPGNHVANAVTPQPPTVPAQVGKEGLSNTALSAAPWAATSPSVQGSGISYGSCGAAGFASASVGSKASRHPVAGPATLAEGKVGAQGAEPAEGHNKPFVEWTAAVPATPNTTAVNNQATKEPMLTMQHATAQRSTPSASTQFATPFNRAGPAAYMTPQSGRASFHTGASVFPSGTATRSVTSKPASLHASAWAETHRRDKASAMLFNSPRARLSHSPAPPSFAAAFNQGQNSFPPTCGHPLDTASPFPIQGLAVTVSKPEAWAKPEAISPPFPPKWAYVGSLGEAAERVSNGAWALLCSDDEENEGTVGAEDAVASEAGHVGEVGQDGKVSGGSLKEKKGVELGLAAGWECASSFVDPALCGPPSPFIAPASSAKSSPSQSASLSFVVPATEAGSKSEVSCSPAHVLPSCSQLVEHSSTGVEAHISSSSSSSAEPVDYWHLGNSPSPVRGGGTGGKMLHTTESDRHIQAPHDLLLDAHGSQALHHRPAPATQPPSVLPNLGGAPEAGWAVVHYQTPSPSSSQKDAIRVTNPKQAATHPQMAIVCPWGVQQGCQSASPALQRHLPHTSGSDISGGSSTARYKPLCLNWCGVPTTQGKGVPGGPVCVLSMTSTPSTQKVDSQCLDDLRSDAESKRPLPPLTAGDNDAMDHPSKSRLPLATPVHETEHGVERAHADLSALAGFLAKPNSGAGAAEMGANLWFDGLGHIEHSTPMPDLEVPDQQADNGALAFSLYSKDLAEGPEIGLVTPEVAHSAAVAAAAGNVGAGDSHVGAGGFEVDAAEEAEAMGSIHPLAMHQSNGSNEDMQTVPGLRVEGMTGTQISAGLELGTAGEGGYATADADCLAQKDQQQVRGTRRWRCHMTEEQEKEVRRRAAALQIHISPYFKRSRSRAERAILQVEKEGLQ